MIANHEFLEHAQVFDNSYGTGVRTVQEALSNGEQLLLEIDWQGARQVRARLPEACSIFILPPSRACVGASASKGAAPIPMRSFSAACGTPPRTWVIGREFDYVVINDRFEQAIEDLQAIVENRGSHLVARAPGSGAIGRRGWLTLEHTARAISGEISRILQCERRLRGWRGEASFLL